jgi:glyoxylase-like metal-dependent hydrolase (beta-lactamase superfamily II)
MKRTDSVAEVMSGIYRLTGGVANFYAIEDGGRYTLVDAGTPKDWSLLLEVLRLQGASLDAIDAVLLTHAHADHTGFAERARSEAHAEVWVSEQDEAIARGGKPSGNDGSMVRYLLRKELYRTVLSLSRRGGAKVVPIAEVSTFKDGEVIDVPGKPRAIHAPGHTAGNSALLMDQRRALLSGDTLVTHNPLTGREGPQIMPSGFNQDTTEALKSLSALEGLGADVLLPGHGDPWKEDIEEAVRLARTAGAS